MNGEGNIWERGFRDIGKRLCFVSSSFFFFRLKGIERNLRKERFEVFWEGKKKKLGKIIAGL